MVNMRADSAGLPTHEVVYRRLRDMILFGELAPGQPVTIQGLVERLEVGMTPVREALRRLMAWYLCREQRRGRYALDPVAHFHLSNGAQVARLNWAADLSEKGRRQSAGMMVNYRYELPRIEARSQSYTVDGAVATSASMKKLLKA